MYGSTAVLLASFSLIAAQCGPCLDGISGNYAEISAPVPRDCSNNGPIVPNLPCQGGNQGPIFLGPQSVPQGFPLGPGPVVIPQQPCSLPLGPGPVIIPQGPNQAPQQNVVLSNNCNCVKTIVRPKLVSSVVSVPSESQTIQTFTRPVTQNINYQFSPPLNAGPSVPTGPIIDNDSSFVSSSGQQVGCNVGCNSGCPAQQFLCR